MNAQGQLNEFSWLAVLLGYPILGIWYWCADQTHVQRVLGARTLQDGQNGALFAEFLKITPVFLMVFPGVIGYVLWQKGMFALPFVAGTSARLQRHAAAAHQPSRADRAARAVGGVHGGRAHELHGGGAQQLRDARVSMDIVKRLRPDIADARVVRIGRVTTGVIMVLAMLWSTQGDQFGTIFEAINKIPMTFAPAVTTVFVLGVMWRRGTKQAAMATLYVGSLVGVVYFVADLPRIGRFVLGGRAPKTSPASSRIPRSDWAFPSCSSVRCWRSRVW